MPANLTPEYLSAEQDYRRAQTHQEKMAALERMLSSLPKHKGTEKLYADLKRKLSQARKEAQKKGGSHAAPFWQVKREGAGQVALAGPPNSGKSSLVRALTHAQPEVADYPFTTHAPAPGMMRFENVQIQLVDLPAASPEFHEPWLPQVLRPADFSALVIDPNDPDVLGETEFLLGLLDSWRIASPRILVGNKIDLDGARENFTAIQDLYPGRFRCVGVSAETGENLDGFARAIFDSLGIVRVYTKPPGKKADLSAPYVLRRGQTVLDAAAHVHRDFAEHLKFARLFHASREMEGRMVERSHVVEDEDILEFHV